MADNISVDSSLGLNADRLLDRPPLPLTEAERAAARAAADAATVARNAAAAEITKLQGDKAFAERLLRGEREAKERWADLHRKADAAGQKNAAELGRELETIAKFGGIPADSPVGRDLADYLSGARAVSPEVRKQILARKDALFADRDWVRKYMDGQTEARQTMMTLSTILSARVTTRSAA